MKATTLTDLQAAYALSAYENAEAFLEQEIDIQTVRAVRATLAIAQRQEPLVPMPMTLKRSDPHPYVQAGAPYGDLSPWQVRATVAVRFSLAQARVERIRNGFKIFVFDALRPLAVQAYMIQHECNRLALDLKRQAFETLDSNDQADIRTRVMKFWAAPNEDPTAPAPHTTGGAVDVTLVDDQGQFVPMGTDIDDLTEKAYPSYYQDRDTVIHANRTLLNTVMQQSGFHRNPVEWWHFSYGDQAWALIESLERPGHRITALYGRV